MATPSVRCIFQGGTMFKATVLRGCTTVGQKGWQKQSVWIYLYNPDGTPMDFPTEFFLFWEQGKPGQPIGEYTVCPSSFTPGRDEKNNITLRLGRLRLLPFKPAAGGKP